MKGEETLYKFLNADGSACNGGRGSWHLPEGGRPGRWMKTIKDIAPCKSGYHLCRKQDLSLWIGPALYMAEAEGGLVCDDKIVTGRARLIRRLQGWDEGTQRLFAADCAERVLGHYDSRFPDDNRVRDCIEVARRYAIGEATDEERAAARAAARSAARAADAAEREWQSGRLLEYAEGVALPLDSP